MSDRIEPIDMVKAVLGFPPEQPTKTPVERLEAAIAKLEADRTRIWSGQWVAHGDSIGVASWSADGPSLDGPVAECPKEVAEFITTLHGTIPAQLAILRTAFRDLRVSGNVRYTDEPSAVEQAIALADAINGASS